MTPRLLCFTLFYACLVMVEVGRMKTGTVSQPIFGLSFFYGIIEQVLSLPVAYIPAQTSTSETVLG